MSYFNGYQRLRVKAIQQFDAIFYEKGNLRRCHYRIWHDLAQHIWGISYKSYLNTLRKDTSDIPNMPSRAVEAVHKLTTQLLRDEPEWKRKTYIHRKKQSEGTTENEQACNPPDTPKH